MSSSPSPNELEELLKEYEGRLEELAGELDTRDPLKGMRERFLMPRQARIYLTGNSLGAQPRGTRERVLEELAAWEELGVEAHFPEANPQRPWVATDEYVREGCAALVGAQAGEVAVMNSLTVNLHLLLV